MPYQKAVIVSNKTLLLRTSEIPIKIFIIRRLGGLIFVVENPILFRAHNKMNLHSNGLFCVWMASGCIDNAYTLPASPFLSGAKMLVFRATIDFVRHS